MLPRAALFSLLSLILIVSVTGLECTIYVSSSDGINNTSCWTGGYQTPCATLDLALQETLTVQDKCSSGTVINLSPGNYTLDTTTLLEQQLLRKNVSIIGMRNGSRYEEVNITCLHVSSSSYHWLGYIVFQCVSLYNCNNVPVSCTQPSFDLTTHNPISQELCPNLTLNVEFINIPLPCYRPYYYGYRSNCQDIQFIASIVDNCNNKEYAWNNKLNVCVTAQKDFDCSNVTIQSYCYAAKDNDRLCYELDNVCLNSPIDSPEVSFYIQTLGLITINISTTVNVTTECADYTVKSCDKNLCYRLPFDYYYYYYYYYRYYYHSFYYYNNTTPHDPCFYYCNGKTECCYDDSTNQCIANCTADTGVPINILTCVKCKDYPLGILVFILIEILPITLMVILIIILNIQLTNGSINGVVIYLQIIAIIFSLNGLNDLKISTAILQHIGAIPCSIFNLDFTPFLYNYSLCIAPHMSPLGAISFWYVIGFYPLLLLLLIYVWIILYDKGFKCVVFITRPFHRCMARFWSMTGIEPSLTNSIASIYILSFTQLTATSFKIWSFNKNSTFYYDAEQEKIGHGFAMLFAVIVLLIVILLPTLYIQFYPFKWFHKLLDCLHLRKQLLISLGDVFTGPYKNRSENTFDYRFMAGLYLLARIIILSQFMFGISKYYLLAIPITQACCSFILAAIVMIFRPFKKNRHNFIEFFTASLITALGCVTIFFFDALPIIVIWFNSMVFIIVIPTYTGYQIYKACIRYNKRKNNSVAVAYRKQESQPLEEDWVADRMENPEKYDEQHVPVKADDLPVEYQQPIATNRATGDLTRPLLESYIETNK